MPGFTTFLFSGLLGNVGYGLKYHKWVTIPVNRQAQQKSNTAISRQPSENRISESQIEISWTRFFAIAMILFVGNGSISGDMPDVTRGVQSGLGRALEQQLVACRLG